MSKNLKRPTRLNSADSVASEKEKDGKTGESAGLEAPGWVAPVLAEFKAGLTADILSHLDTKMNSLQEKIRDNMVLYVQEAIEPISARVTKQSNEITSLKKQVSQVQEDLLKMQRFSMRNNLVFSGVREEKSGGETSAKLRSKVF